MNEIPAWVLALHVNGFSGCFCLVLFISGVMDII